MEAERHPQPEVPAKACLLAVDVGLRTGLAIYTDDGRLRSYRSCHFANRSSLRRAIPGLLREAEPLRLLVLEGGGSLADLWRTAARRRGIAVEDVSAEAWRQALLLPREQRSGVGAKAAARALAHRVILARCDRRPRSRLRTDTAEAILVGLWAAARHGWLADGASFSATTLSGRRFID